MAIYSSPMKRSRPRPSLQWTSRPWDGMKAYSDSKLYNVVLAFAVARLWPETLVTTVDPGWIKPKARGTRRVGRGGRRRRDPGVARDLRRPGGPGDRVTGAYLKRFEQLDAHPAASDVAVQDGLLAALEGLTGVALPR